MEVNTPDPGPRGSRGGRSHPGGLLLFELIDGLLLLVDLVPEAGQLPVMGLPVTLHLHLQGLLRTAPPHTQSQTPRHQLGEGWHSPAGPGGALPLPHSPSRRLCPVCRAPCPSGPLRAQFLRERTRGVQLTMEPTSSGKNFTLRPELQPGQGTSTQCGPSGIFFWVRTVRFDMAGKETHGRFTACVQ